jgi:hypothetical protein
MKKFYLVLFLTFCSFSFGQSNYLVENFNYPAGNLVTAHGWLEHSGVGTNIIETTASGLTFAGYIGSGVGVAATADNTGSDINKAFEGPISSGSVYASFLVKAGAVPYTDANASPYFFHFGTVTTAPNINSAFRARTFILPGTNPATQIKFALTFNSSSPAATETTADYDITGTYLMIIKYTFNNASTSDDSVSMFVLSVGDNLVAEPTTPTIGPITGSAADATLIDAIVIRQYSADQNVILDGFYARNQWDLINAGSSLASSSFKYNSFSIYPNPVTQGQINFNMDGPKNIVIYDLNGRKIIEKNTLSTHLDISEVKKGFYIVKVTSDNKTFSSKILVN